MKTKVCDDGRESSRLICAEKVQPQVKFCSKYAFVKNQLFLLKLKKKIKDCEEFYSRFSDGSKWNFKRC